MKELKKNVSENVLSTEELAPIASKMNGVLALLREKIMREYGLSAEEYAKVTITITNGKITIK